MQQSVLEQIPIMKVENRYNMTSSSTQYPAPKHGGRVPNINDANTFQFAAMPYKMYAEGKSIYGDDARRDLIGTQQQKTPLNEVYFSRDNMDHLQQAIINQVYIMSGGKYSISPQSEDSLRIIMRSYYLMYARNDPMNVGGELRELNGRVIGYAAGKVYSEVDFHMFYRKDLEEFAPAIANPINVGVRGTRTNELKSFF